ncbi:murein L,D-transpeptidase catalytic domain family protein [Croceibacterium xixiisoli]|nr:murein L,D-transpeptidase catalytic domain family protein [Croceibacterium xixiisoli]
MSDKPSSSPLPHVSRRALMFAGAAVAAGGLARSATGPLLGPAKPLPPPPVPVAARVPATPVKASLGSLNPALLQRALAALNTHSRDIGLRDRIAIVDFTAPSADARMHFLDVKSGDISHMLVAHGSGSDPGHTGFLQKFSNAFNSNASSEGAFVTADYYVGKHGRSQRIRGLDPTNNNALDRAVVIHGAWYAEADMVKAHGKLGRSQGCFAVGDSELATLFDYMGEGRLLYAAKA